MEYRSIEWYSISTNRTIGTKGRVECTPSNLEEIGNILSLYNEIHFTNGIPMDRVPFHWNPFVRIGPIDWGIKASLTNGDYSPMVPLVRAF